MVLRASSSAVKPKHASKSLTRKVLPVLTLAILSILLLLYPVVVTQLNNWEQNHVADSYTRDIHQADDEQLSKQLAAAQEYNKTRSSGPILDPWLARISQDNKEYQAYLAELNAHEVMARLVVPTADVDLPVYHGTTEDVLQKGVGHLYGSDLPVGGPGTHSVLTAHTGLVHATLFDQLDDVEEGDPIYIGVSGQKMKYEVRGIRVVLPEETNSLRADGDKDLITLITCTPYGINSHRLLVTAERVPLDEEAEDAFSPSKLHWPWWMWAFMSLALVIAAATALWIRSMRNKHKAKYRLPSSFEEEV